MQRLKDREDEIKQAMLGESVDNSSILIKHFDWQLGLAVSGGKVATLGDGEMA